MSIKELIATILHEHRELISQDTAWDECVECSHQGQPWAEHVASVLVAELGLTEETRLNVMSSGGMTTDHETGVTTSHSDYRYDRRYVTAWEPAVLPIQTARKSLSVEPGAVYGASECDA